MQAISYTAARSNFAQTMDKVCQDHDPVIITRQNADSVVLISLEDYQAISETGYLLKSPKNAARLAEALKEIAEGKMIKRNLLDDTD